MTTPEAFSGPETAKRRNFSLLGPLLAPFEPWGGPRGADWRPKHFHTLCLGGTHPYQVLGPLNGPLRHSWGPQKGPFGPRKALLGAPEGLGVPWGACFWPNCHWLVQRDDPHPYHVLGPLNGPLWHSWGPQKGPFGPRKALLGAPEGLGVPWGACFWPNCHWLVQRDDPHPYHVLGPLNGPLWHSWGPQKGPFWPRKALLGAPEVLGGPRGTYFWPNCHWLIRLAEPYPYHVLQPLQRPLRHSWGPQRGNILGKRSLLGAPGVLQTFHTTQMGSQ